MNKPMFDRVAILGIGLIGSSIAHAMRPTILGRGLPNLDLRQ